jgi:hypothetical protein
MPQSRRHSPNPSASTNVRFFPENLLSAKGAPALDSSSRKPSVLSVNSFQQDDAAGTPPPPELLASLKQELAASDALLLQRKFSAASDGYADVYGKILAWSFTPFSQLNDEITGYFKESFFGLTSSSYFLNNYKDAIDSYFTLAGVYSETLKLQPVELAGIWLKVATAAVEWGNSLFRTSALTNSNLDGALGAYNLVIVLTGSTAAAPEAGASQLYDIDAFSDSAAQARTILANIPALLSGQATAESLNANPEQAAVIVEIYQQLVKIASGLDYWGHHQNTVPIWTFDYLQGVAINFAQLAITAERDYITFQDRNDQEQFSRQQLVQTISQATSEVNAAAAQANAAAVEVNAYATAAAVAQQRADDAAADAQEYAQNSDLAIQFDALKTQLAGGDNGNFDQLNALASMLMNGQGLRLLSDTRSGSGGDSVSAGVAAAELASSRLSRGYEVDSLTRAASELSGAAAQANEEVTAATAKALAAIAAQAAAQLHAQSAQQNLAAFDAQTFTPDVWQQMADVMYRLYRRYLGMALQGALLMQRAYNFETDQPLSFIKQDYSGDEVKGLLAADALMADIQTFSYDLITSGAGKPQPMRQTISLAQNYPFAFENQFRKTGIMEFETRIEDFDYLYPGTYAGRIENVEVDVDGIIPVRGLSGTLTNSGISGYRVPAAVWGPNSSGLKYRLQSRETLVLSDYNARDDALLIPSDSRMMRVFQGAGLASTWRLEIPREVNDIDFGTMIDVRLTFYYQARYDPDLHDRVLADLASRPGVNSRQRGLQLRWLYPDAFYTFVDTGTLAFSLAASDFRYNEMSPILTSIGALIVTDGTVAPSGLSLGLTTPGKTAISATTDAEGSIDSGSSAPAWQGLTGSSALGDYALSVSAADNPTWVTDGRLSLTPIVNAALLFGYSFTPRV